MFEPGCSRFRFTRLFFTVLLEVLSTGYPAHLRSGIRLKTVGFRVVFTLS